MSCLGAVVHCCRAAIQQLYQQYKDDDVDAILADGIVQLCQDLGRRDRNGGPFECAQSMFSAQSSPTVWSASAKKQVQCGVEMHSASECTALRLQVSHLKTSLCWFSAGTLMQPPWASTPKRSLKAVRGVWEQGRHATIAFFVPFFIVWECLSCSKKSDWHLRHAGCVCHDVQAWRSWGATPLRS
jgi:hypothetical protein